MAEELWRSPKQREGEGWHREMATSPFSGERYSYIVIDSPLSPPWRDLAAPPPASTAADSGASAKPAKSNTHA